jgi:membrane-associated protease RseP (regulator of RpoE activity)
VLAQLRPASSYADLARTIADIRPGIVAAVSASAGGGAALRIREDAAVTLSPGPSDTLLASDRATGLTIVRHQSGDMPGLMPWVPRLLDYPRYLVAADVAGENVALRPVFTGGLFLSSSPLWSGELWVLPPSTPIAPGTFVFTTDGAFAGLGVNHAGEAAIVPATVLFGALDRLQRQSGEAGDFGIAVQPLSPQIAAATGAAAGVVISAIDSAGSAAGTLVATEVIEAIDGQDISTPEHWRARVARARVGETLTLRVRNGQGVRDVQVTAGPFTAVAAPADDASLGLRLLALPRIGAQVQEVQPRSRADRAAIQQGDVITVAGGQPLPTPAQVTRAFASLPEGGSLLVALTRGSEHRVVAIAK